MGKSGRQQTAFNARKRARAANGRLTKTLDMVTKVREERRSVWTPVEGCSLMGGAGNCRSWVISTKIIPIR